MDSLLVVWHQSTLLGLIAALGGFFYLYRMQNFYRNGYPCDYYSETCHSIMFFAMADMRIGLFARALWIICLACACTGYSARLANRSTWSSRSEEIIHVIAMVGMMVHFLILPHPVIPLIFMFVFVLFLSLDLNYIFFEVAPCSVKQSKAAHVWMNMDMVIVYLGLLMGLLSNTSITVHSH